MPEFAHSHHGKQQHAHTGPVIMQQSSEPTRHEQPGPRFTRSSMLDTQLTHVCVQVCMSLTSVDTADCVARSCLMCHHCPALTGIDLQGCSRLRDLVLEASLRMCCSTLDLADCVQLQNLDCDECPLDDLLVFQRADSLRIYAAVRTTWGHWIR